MDEESASELLPTICAWAQAQSDIRALIVTGSHARGQADDLSDLDLEIFTRTPEQYVQSDRWMTEIDAVWTYLPLHNDRGLPTRLIVFTDGLKVDFTICPVTALAEMVATRRVPPLYDRGYRVLVDKDQVAEKLPPASRRPPMTSPPTEAEFISVMREFWFEVCQVAKYLKRNDLWAAKYRDRKVKELLLTVIEWYEKSLHGWDHPTERLGTRMKEWVEPEVWAGLMGAFAHFDAEDSWKALDATMSIFRSLTQETAGRLGHRYPREVDEQLSQYVRSLQER